MPEAEIPRLDATRRERLAALGIELLELRGELAATAGPSSGGAPGTAGATRLHVSGIDWPSAERLPRAVIAALGLRPEEVASGTCPDRPTLVFGPGPAAPDSVRVPAPAHLRDAAAKRALWPTLRRLRRRLAADAPA